MDERRKYPREELAAAMICAFEAQAVSTFCLVKNVSVEGALLECPAVDESDPFEIGDAVRLRDIVPGSKALFDGTAGQVAWIYRRFIGLQFDEPIMDAPDALHQWLRAQELV